jgi:ABC-type glycerol-3-phosphate transport system substrate-binding protein
MKRLLSLLLICTLTLTLSACGDKTPTQEAGHTPGTGTAQLINTHFDAYAYQIERVEPYAPGSYIHAALAHGDRLYYVSFEADSQNQPVLVITSTDMDGSDAGRIEMQSPGNEVSSFNITNDGNFAFFMFNRIITPQGSNLTAFYIEYDSNGIELTRHELREFTLVLHPQPNTFAVLNDGRVLAIDSNSNVMREIDFNNNSLGETFPVAGDTGRLQGIFSASTSSSFDFLISDGSYLYGYSVETNEQTVILSWIELGLVEVFSAQIGIFHDGRIFMLIADRNAAGEWVTELYIITPVNRDEMPEKITLILGGLTVSIEARRAVAQFNRQNSLYHIEIYEYVNQADIPAGDLTSDTLNVIWNQALMRFQVDLMAGKIPDIISMPSYEIIERGFLLDLNPLIDADPDINRIDFFPNVLTKNVRPDGTLPVIADRFYINTIISRNETLGHIETWTPAELISLIHGKQGMYLPFGTHLSREQFMLMIRILGFDLLDSDNFQVNFDSEEFISLLNTAMLLPPASDIPYWLSWDSPVLDILRMQEGEQVLSYVMVSSPSKYQLFMESFDDSFALGLPTARGGEHIIIVNRTMGIGISTSHTDAAWDFLRSFLLPSASEFYRGVSGDIGFPVRIDLFNELIEDAMTPRTFINWEGETVEYPRETIIKQSDISVKIDLFAMKEETANSLRAFIESAVNPVQGISEELWKIIEGDIADFFAGLRSAEETARIVQNRAERWMSEQQLLAGG